MNISVMKDVYSQVAEMFGMKIGAVSKNTERMTILEVIVDHPEILF